CGALDRLGVWTVGVCYALIRKSTYMPGTPRSGAQQDLATLGNSFSSGVCTRSIYRGPIASHQRLHQKLQQPADRGEPFGDLPDHVECQFESVWEAFSGPS